MEAQPNAGSGKLKRSKGIMESHERQECPSLTTQMKHKAAEVLNRGSGFKFLQKRRRRRRASGWLDRKRRTLTTLPRMCKECHLTAVSGTTADHFERNYMIPLYIRQKESRFIRGVDVFSSHVSNLDPMLQFWPRVRNAHRIGLFV